MTFRQQWNDSRLAFHSDAGIYFSIYTYIYLLLIITTKALIQKYTLF